VTSLVIVAGETSAPQRWATVVTIVIQIVAMPASSIPGWNIPGSPSPPAAAVAVRIAETAPGSRFVGNRLRSLFVMH
jgi:hypothetical protein